MNFDTSRFSRRSFLKSVSCFAASATGLSALNGCMESSMSGAGGARRNKPNVLMIVSDDQGCGDLAKYAQNPEIHTPNLDKLYSESTRLTNFIASPLCAPTRASLMTGRYNYRTGVWDTWMGRLGLHEEEVTIADCLLADGYKTGIFGKWHLGENIPMRPQDNGFEETLLWRDSMGARFNPTMEHNGTRGRMEGFLTDIFIDHTIDFMRHNRNKRFFAYFASFLPHDNSKPQVPAEYIKPYEHLNHLTQGDKEVYAMVTKLDECVGKLLNELETLGLENDTLVLFFSDNGPLKMQPDLVSEPEILACKRHDMGDRYNCGLRGGKTNVYDGGINTPCFVRYPGVVPAGRDLDTMIAHIDIKPTLLGFCKADALDSLKMDGMDVSPLLCGKNQKIPNRSIIIQSHRVEVPQAWENSCVRQQDWKLINGTDLYDLRNDPGETVNVASKYPRKVQELRAEYEKWFADITSKNPFVPGITYIGSKKQPKVSFNIHHRHPTGWPIRVMQAGQYNVTVKDIQHELFSGSSFMAIRFGSKGYRKKIHPTNKNIVFEGIDLPAGDTVFDIGPEGYKKPAKMYYGNEDFGYRDVVIEPAE